MHRWVRWAASFVVTAGLVGLGGATATAATPATSARPMACVTAGKVKITSLAFVPSAVVPGQSSTATLHARNCTAQTLQTTTDWSAQLTGSGGGVPAGCPVIDPVSRPATFPPNGTISIAAAYLVPSGCTATALHLTVKVVGSGGVVLATGSATLTINP